MFEPSSVEATAETWDLVVEEVAALSVDDSLEDLS